MNEHIVAYSLIDISDSSALQEQNLNTLIQTISLRANPMYISVNLMGNQDMTEYDFGTEFGGTQNVWLLSFVVEQSSVFANRDGDLGGLEDDIHNVPVITDLMESVSVNPAVFDSKNAKTINIYFNRQILNQ